MPPDPANFPEPILYNVAYASWLRRELAVTAAQIRNLPEVNT